MAKDNAGDSCSGAVAGGQTCVPNNETGDATVNEDNCVRADMQSVQTTDASRLISLSFAFGTTLNQQ